VNPIAEISKIDEMLNVLREEWLLADERSKPRWMRRIDEQLDKRLDAMKRRDA